MRTRTPLAVAGALAATALLLAACGTPDTGAGEGSSASADVGDDTLTVGQTSGITQLDPNTTTLSTERVLWNLLWDGLTTQTEQGDVEGELATDWTTSDDQLTWTFTLRDDVTYHDGRAFTATDAVKNIERVLDPDIASPQRAKISSVTGAAAPDDTTLVLTLSAPMSQLPAALVDVKMTDVDDIDAVNTDANGTGPYTLVDFVPDQQVTLAANPDYFGGEPEVATVEIVKYSDITSAESAVAGGAIDVLWGLPFDQLESQVGTGLTAVTPADPSQTAVLEVDTLSAPFDDPRARQALSYATDRAAIQAASYGGLGELNLGSTLVSPVNPYATDDVTDYTYDLDRAKELFAEAGVAEGQSFTCWATAGGSFPEFATTCQILQASLAEIGIDLTIETNESSTWIAAFYPAGKSYPGLIVTDYLSREAAPLPFVADYFGEGGWSPSNWPGTPEYEAAKQLIKTATDDEGVTEGFARFQTITSREQPLINILNVGTPSVVRPGVSGVWMEGNGTTHVEQASLGG
ncbi:MAG TPA: ABC transporter substrate-binding protein [Cellulomonas sp.]